jgi:hypothetical protein
MVPELAPGTPMALEVAKALVSVMVLVSAMALASGPVLGLGLVTTLVSGLVLMSGSEPALPAAPVPAQAPHRLAGLP